MIPARTFKVGQRVVYDAFGRVGGSGEVVSVSAPRKVAIGGVRARVRVKWDSGHTGTVDDRVLRHEEKS